MVRTLRMLLEESVSIDTPDAVRSVSDHSPPLFVKNDGCCPLEKICGLPVKSRSEQFESLLNKIRVEVREVLDGCRKRKIGQQSMSKCCNVTVIIYCRSKGIDGF
jgi:hypothetical protein